MTPIHEISRRGFLGKSIAATAVLATASAPAETGNPLPPAIAALPVLSAEARTFTTA